MIKMKKRKKNIKKLIIGSITLLFIAILTFQFLKNQEIFSSEEIVFYEPPKKIDMESKINIKEIEENIGNMNEEEIKEVIKQIEKEIERLESNLD